MSEKIRLGKEEYHDCTDCSAKEHCPIFDMALGAMVEMLMANDGDREETLKDLKDIAISMQGTGEHGEFIGKFAGTGYGILKGVVDGRAILEGLPGDLLDKFELGGLLTSITQVGNN